jgi:hypothetical protein
MEYCIDEIHAFSSGLVTLRLFVQTVPGNVSLLTDTGGFRELGMFHLHAYEWTFNVKPS